MKKRLIKKTNSKDRVAYLPQFPLDTMIFTIQDGKRVVSTQEQLYRDVIFTDIEVTQCFLAKKSPSGKYRRDRSVRLISGFASNLKDSVITKDDSRELPF